MEAKLIEVGVDAHIQLTPRTRAHEVRPSEAVFCLVINHDFHLTRAFDPCP